MPDPHFNGGVAVGEESAVRLEYERPCDVWRGSFAACDRRIAGLLDTRATVGEGEPDDSFAVCVAPISSSVVTSSALRKYKSSVEIFIFAVICGSSQDLK